MTPQPFRVAMPDAVIADLRERLRARAFPTSRRSVATRMYSDIRRWTVMPKGGHFAALEQPEALAHEIREFFRPLR